MSIICKDKVHERNNTETAYLVHSFAIVTHHSEYYRHYKQFKIGWRSEYIRKAQCELLYPSRNFLKLKIMGFCITYGNSVDKLAWNIFSVAWEIYCWCLFAINNTPPIHLSISTEKSDKVVVIISPCSLVLSFHSSCINSSWKHSSSHVVLYLRSTELFRIVLV